MSTIAGNYDVLKINGPLLNRARLFVHKLQCNKEINWDNKLSDECCHEWRNIAKQVNGTPPIEIPRMVGTRDSQYRLIAFSDASKTIYGVVVYIQDLHTNKTNFLIARNRLVNKQLETKSVPSLEFQAISLGAEVLIEQYKELSGENCVIPIKIVELCIYLDSMVSLN